LDLFAGLDRLILGVQEGVVTEPSKVPVDRMGRGAAVATPVGDEEPAVASEGLQSEMPTDRREYQLAGRIALVPPDSIEVPEVGEIACQVAEIEALALRNDRQDRKAASFGQAGEGLDRRIDERLLRDEELESLLQCYASGMIPQGSPYHASQATFLPCRHTDARCPTG